MRRVFIVLLFAFQFLFSQNFEVTVSSNKVGLNETFEISFSLDDNGSNFSPPPFSDFYILSGPSQSKSTSIINGQFTQESSYKYVLKPKKIGVFTILPANIKVKGKTIGTRPMTIQVQKGTVAKKPNTPYEKVAKKVHLEVKSSRKACYIGEPVVLTYTLYFNLNISNLNPKMIKYSDFWTEDVDIDSKTKKTMYNGQAYNAAVIKQVVLIPQSSGVKKIDQLTIDLVASVPTNRRDFFGMLSTQSVNYMVESNGVVIDVLPLPGEGKPVDFSGAVGDFKLHVDLDKDSLNVNESATFSVKIIGAGNLNLLTSPSVSFDDALEVFDPKQSETISVDNKGINGYKKDEYLIVPRHKGVYHLNEIFFTFFNPKTKRYVALKSNKKKIHVGAEKFESEDGFSQSFINKEKINLINEDVKFIKTNYHQSVIPRDFTTSNLFYILLLLPLFVLLVSILYKKDYLSRYFVFKRDFLKQVNKKINVANAYLKKRKLGEFHAKLLDVLFFYISDRFLVSKSTLNANSIKNSLEAHGVDNNSVSEYLSLIKTLELYRYAPSTNQDLGDHKGLLNRVSRVIRKIDKMI